MLWQGCRSRVSGYTQEGRAPDAHLVLSMDNDVATRAWNPYDDVDPQSCCDKTHDIECNVSPVRQEGRMEKALKVAEIGAVVDIVDEVKPRIARALSHQETKSWTAVPRNTLLSKVDK